MIWMYLCACLSVCVCVFVCICLCLCVFEYESVRVWMVMCICVCVTENKVGVGRTFLCHKVYEVKMMLSWLVALYHGSHHLTINLSNSMGEGGWWNNSDKGKVSLGKVLNKLLRKGLKWLQNWEVLIGKNSKEAREIVSKSSVYMKLW